MITPRQAKQNAKPSQQDMKRLEERIDSAITERFKMGMNYTTINAELFPTRMAMNEIISKYRSAGWNVEYTSDQREGDFLTITEKTRQSEDYFGPYGSGGARPYE